MSKEGTQTLVRTIVLAVLAVAVFAGGIAFDRLLLATGVLAQAEPVDLSLLEEARNIIQTQYVDRADTTDQALVYGALTGMVESLGDTGHSRFMTPEMVADQHNRTAGEFEGIGAYVEMRDGFVTVVTPIDNSPAQAAGVQPGDIVIAVDGEDVTGQTLQEVVSKILGPAGTDVEITFVNPETGEERTLTITRARIDLENVTWTMLPGTTVAQIRISGFSRGVGQDVADAVDAATAAGATGLILDLRNNPGGLLNEAVRVASEFLPEGSAVVLRQDAEGDITQEMVEDVPDRTGLPLVVLINEGSASASEIVSGALQDYDRATLVGQTTFGTGTVLNEFDLSDGSAMLLATEKWLTPDGRVIWRQGIEPDVSVELEPLTRLVVPETADDLTAEELRASGDAQLLNALQLLTGEGAATDAQPTVAPGG